MPRLVLLFVILFWIAASFLFPLNRFFLPNAVSLVGTVLNTSFLLDLLMNLSITFIRVGAGTVIALLVAIPLGILMAKNAAARSLAEPVIDFVRGIPIAMLFPIFIFFVGLGELSRILMVITLAFPIVALSVYLSARPNEDNSERIAYFNLRKGLLSRETLLRMVIWEALPGVLTGTRLAISLGLVVVIVTEMYFVASSGIGWRAFRAYENFQIDSLYFYIFIVGLSSMLVNRFISRLKF
jgi:NitT/TauT family transport system permease protein